MIVTRFVFVSALLLATSYSQSLNSECLCDLTTNLCDTRCCCDSSCSATQLQQFKISPEGCLPSSSPPVPPVTFCISNSTLKSTRLSEDLYFYNDEGMFCVERPFVPESPTLDVRAPISTDASLSLELGGLWPSATASKLSFYVSGGPLKGVPYNGSAVHDVTLPRRTGDGSCEATPVVFGQDLPLESCVAAPSLSTEDEQRRACVSVFNAKSILNWGLALNPATQSYLTPIFTSTCLNSNGTTVVGGCSIVGSLGLEEVIHSAPEVNDTICPTALVDATVVVTYSAALSLSDVAINYTVQAVPFVELEGRTIRVAVSFVNSDASANPIYRSGNPGYQMGRPLLAALVNGDNSLTLTTLALSSGAVCGDGQVSAVAFGYDSVMGCTAHYTINDLVDCAALNERFMSYLLPDPLATHLGVWGNSLVEDTSNWLTLSPPTSLTEVPTRTTSNTCTNMVTGLSLKVLTTLTGEVNNPQAKVVGATLEWIGSSTVRFPCTSVAECAALSASASARTGLRVSIDFVDVERTSTEWPAGPRFLGLLPTVPTDTFGVFKRNPNGVRRTRSAAAFLEPLSRPSLLLWVAAVLVALGL